MTTSQWFDAAPQQFTADQRATTTVLFGGMTQTHDQFIATALSSMGYNVKAIPTPDNKALQLGKEFGNRGQCNPTYYTSGNIVKYLLELEQSGVDRKDIVENYLYITPSSCGPCRFGSYATEYRKALRDAGFEGFRIIGWQQTGNVLAGGAEAGFNVTPKLLFRAARAAMLADILVALGYRMRPYEKNKNEINEIQEKCRSLISEALINNKSINKTLKICKKMFAKVELDRTRIKPKVSVIGEFWAMTTEGEGNYFLKRFLEEEGAEVEVQPFTAWILYLAWGRIFNLKQRLDLKGTDLIAKDGGSQFALDGVNTRKNLIGLTLGDKGLRFIFNHYAKKMGLLNYKLSDMDELSDVSHKYYDNNLRGGEGHMEVGKLIVNVTQKKSNMTVSVKPFGCMPSSGVSDGVQSIITEKFPDALFLPIETTGDGAVNVYSRVQMQLFKAKQLAEKECEDIQQKKEGGKKKSNFYYPKNGLACTAANLSV